MPHLKVTIIRREWKSPNNTLSLIVRFPPLLRVLQIHFFRMRLATEAELQRATQVALWGGIRGGVTVGCIVGCGLYLFDRRRSLHHHQSKIPLQLKVFLLTASILGGFGFFAEKAILELEREQHPERSISVSDLHNGESTDHHRSRFDWAVWTEMLYQYRYPLICK